jgi:hypothetical protein
MKKKTKMWSSKWPTKVGEYWFYGWPFGNTGLHENSDPEWARIRVIKISNGTMTIRDGHFWDKQDGWKGKFIEVEFPPTPDLE